MYLDLQKLVIFVEFKSVILLFVFCSIPASNLIILSSLSLSCELFEHFLEIYFDYLVFLTMSFCIVFLMVALGPWSANCGSRATCGSLAP